MLKPTINMAKSFPLKYVKFSSKFYGNLLRHFQVICVQGMDMLLGTRVREYQS